LVDIRNRQIASFSPDAKDSLTKLGLELKAEPDNIIVKLHEYVIVNQNNFLEMTRKLGSA
jgi:hypothetical protein